ncbi:MAG: 30S ribosomal protein S20 [Planctomycetota bacterium]|jgi:small subunit ribosomal protein S20|nr:30S ribosomal protein S20 [Pirellulaceae bacterium]MEC7355083.1 30S ribosomal protein S20 [Planctomycetota bacterium]MEC7429355.1 30S ribosomal protein S20 [Planctomycetota bacterium]MEC7430152.1 30S ribosomal protein S20 [Planctomycetota bacterium]MEC7449226.1 30S ribosomal protein S20 [Planctomycetota bacterium]
MPNSKSAEKRLRQNAVRRERNRAVKSAVKTQVKKVVSAIRDGNVELAETEYRAAAKQLDRAGAHRVIHKNAAARKKSRLQKLIKAAK